MFKPEDLMQFKPSFWWRVKMVFLGQHIAITTPEAEVWAYYYKGQIFVYRVDVK